MNTVVEIRGVKLDYRKLISLVVLYLIAIAAAAVMLIPFLWMVSTSLKEDVEIFKFPPVFIPTVWKFGNYVEAWQAANFSRYFLNTTVVASGGTLLTLAICSLAGYAFAKIEFSGREALFWLILGSMMIPATVTLIPTFLILKRLPLMGGNDILGQGGIGWLNSYWGLIVPGAGGTFGVFLLRQFFKTIPEDLLDAARMDGCPELGILVRIVLPLSRAALTTLAIFTFQGYWNDFVWPLIVTSSDEMRTVQVGLTVFRMRYETDWGPLMSGVTMATLPLIVVFLLGQRYFTRGVALTGLKG